MRDRELFEQEISRVLPEWEFPQAQNEYPEKFTSGATRYLSITVSSSNKLEVGAYVPPAAKAAAKFDVIVYFHGDIIEACKTINHCFHCEGINYLWNTPGFLCLRRDLHKSGRAAVLLVPKMGEKVGNDFKNLGAAGRFDLLVNDSIKQLRAAGVIGSSAGLGNIVLAAHSGGSFPMHAVLNGANKLGKQIRACWGFEALYAASSTMKSWLKTDKDLIYRHYRRPGWKDGQVTNYAGVKNFVDTPTASGHCESVDEFWKEALSHMPTTPGTSVQYEFEEPGTKGGTAPPAFTLKTWTLQSSATKLVSQGSAKDFLKSKKDHPTFTPQQHPAFVQVQQAPSKFLKNIIKRAGVLARADGKTAFAAILDKDQWFKNFTRISFLGRDFRDGEYVHVEMAKKLQEVENRLIKLLGGTAKSVGDTLLNNRDEKHAGSRTESGTAAYSYHMFGLAIDVNYLGDPFVQDSDVARLNVVLRRASQLLRSTVVSYTRGHGAAYYDTIAGLDALLEEYFALLDNATALTTALAAIKTGPWRGLSATRARSLIQDDVNRLSKTLERRWSKADGSDLRPIFKARAILDFDKRFVRCMENAGLDWGAWYGDLMHFDMRDTGVGVYVQRAIAEHKSRATKQMNDFLAVQDHGFHEFVD
jgi:hypothetical protein